ncbi:MAG TPA: amidase, partial [Thalassobaculum sp.]
MAGLLDLDLVAARDALRARTISSTELTSAYLARIEATRELNAYITVTADKALAMAAAADERLARGEGGGLDGVPIAIKDLYCTEGVPTTAASHILDGFRPTYESTVTAKLWEAGAVMLGKTNMDEFAMGSSNGTSYYGPAISPWRGAQDAEIPLVPGGSSGGSAAAV